MSLRNILVVILSAVFVWTCDEVDRLLTFKINDQTAIRIEGSTPLSLPLEVPTPAVTSNSRQQFENNNTHADLVKDVRLDRAKLTITSPEGKTFGFLKTIRIFISAPGQSEIELAVLDDVPQAESIELIPSSQKLDPYVKASSYDLRTEITTDETLTQSVDVHVDLTFQVTADTY